MKRPAKALSGGNRRPSRSSGRARRRNSQRLRRCRLEFLEPRAMLSAAAVCDHLFYSAAQPAPPGRPLPGASWGSYPLLHLSRAKTRYLMLASFPAGVWT